jgi:Acyl-CoA reductase (LuxC)
MNIKERISNFESLGIYLKKYVSLQNGNFLNHSSERSILKNLDSAVSQAEIENPWFTRENIMIALRNISISLERVRIEQFIHRYAEERINHQASQTIGVVMAGNIPVVGFHDFFCILMVGHHFLGKLSSEDSRLLPAIADILIGINPEFNSLISFSKDRITDFDAIIATGNNNTYRYFEYYFGKYPHILRKNHNGVAILTGMETKEELLGLADDIFIFFGKGCRSISKLYLPEGYNFQLLQEPFARYNHLFNHHKYRNNYDYYKILYLIDKIPLIDMGQVLLIESMNTASPVSVINYEFYNDLLKLKNKFTVTEEQIQCIVCHDPAVSGSVKPGNAQSPELWDYADRVDTMKFLLNLKSGFKIK